MLILLVRTKTLAVMLGPEGVGIMAVVDRLLALISQTASFSLPFAALRFLPSVWGKSRADYILLFKQMRNVIALTTLVAIIASFAINLFYPALWGKELLQYRSIMFAAIACLPIIAFLPFLRNAIAGQMQHNKSMLFFMAHAVIFTLSGILGVWWKGLEGLYLLYAVFGIMLIFPVVTRLTKVPLPDQPAKAATGFFSLKMPPNIWKFCFTFFGLAFIAPFAILQVNYQVLSHYGAETAGWMQAAVGISLAVRGVLGAANAAFLTPNLNKGGSPKERMDRALEYNKTLVIISCLTVVPILLYPHIFVRILYSENFLPGATFVALFVLGEIIILMTGTYQALIIALDHIAYHVIQNIIAQLALLVMALVMIKSYGILGAGLAMIISYLYLLLAATLFLKFKYRLTTPLHNATLIVYTLIALCIGGGVGATFSGYSLEIIVGKTALYLIIVSGLWFFLNKQERNKLSEMLHKIFPRFSS